MTQTATADARKAARCAGLRYVTDSMPGFQRRRRGRGFEYLDADGNRVREKKTLDRIRQLAIPPAWTDVWISPVANGHLQATGRDARGRKQYRYHADWREVRDATKFDRVVSFNQALPRIHDAVAKHMTLPDLPREKILATVILLLEKSLIRVGNDEYMSKNGSYGLTTLRNRHVDISGSRIRFSFRGKSGQHHDVAVTDQRISTIIKRMRDLPGQELFQYLDDDGERHQVTSQDVNEYLREISGDDFTAKDFRTWAGTIMAAQTLAEMTIFESEAEARRNVVAAIAKVAELLGNTAAVCRKCYVHPGVIDGYLDGTLPKLRASTPPNSFAGAVMKSLNS